MLVYRGLVFERPIAVTILLVIYLHLTEITAILQHLENNDIYDTKATIVIKPSELYEARHNRILGHQGY